MNKIFLQLVVTSLVIIGSQVAQAATIGYWQFNDTPGFLEDSSGNNLTLTNNGGATQTTTSPGPGDAAAFTGSETLTVADNPLFTVTDFTIENYFNANDVSGGNTKVLVSQFEGASSQASWFLAVKNQKIRLALYPTGSTSTRQEINVFSVASGIDYYVGASVDFTTDEATIYLQDLTNGGALQSSTVSITVSTVFNSSADFAIAGTATPSSLFNGTIGDVRFSNTPLTSGELLINIPEPSEYVYIAGLLGLALAFIKHRGRAQ